MAFSILIHGSKLFLISLANWVDWRQQKTQTVVGFWSWRIIEIYSNLANVQFHWHHLCFHSCCNFLFINKQLELSPAIKRSLIGWKRVLYESWESITNGAKTVTSSANSLVWKLGSNAWGIKGFFIMRQIYNEALTELFSTTSHVYPYTSFVL